MSKIKLEHILDKTHGLCKLADRLNWSSLNKDLGVSFFENSDRKNIPVRMLAGLHYLKHLESENDDNIVEKFCENPYWQYFCGMETFSHHLPCHPTTLLQWRKQFGKKRIKKLLENLIKAN